MIRRNSIENDPAELVMTVDTWKSDSYGLYDYESTSNHSTKRQHIRGACKLFRNWATSETTVVSLDEVKRGKLPHEDYQFLVSIIRKKTQKGESYAISAPESSMPSELTDGNDLLNSTFLSVKTVNHTDGTQGYCLAPGDIIRLGRLSFLVTECRNNEKTLTFKNPKAKDLARKRDNVLTVEASASGSCRICLGDEASDDNLLVSACKCSGSCALVHVDCLKIWIDSKVKKESKGAATVYNFSKFECELCKSPYPVTIQNGSISVDLMTVEKPNKPYIVLESIPDKKNAGRPNNRNPLEVEPEELKPAKSLYIIAADELKSVKLGRGHQSDVVLDDISVSRAHSEILFKKDKFFLRDLGSKFGTLVNFREGRDITDDLKIQCGRTVYTFKFNPKIRTCQYLP